jgi:hypothetical protein
MYMVKSLHIVMDVMVVFHEAFPSIHPSLRLIIHPWMASYKEENPGKKKNPPSAHMSLSRKGMPSPRVLIVKRLS